MANHESQRTTSIYDRRGDQVSLDEAERILICTRGGVKLARTHTSDVGIDRPRPMRAQE